MSTREYFYDLSDRGILSLNGLEQDDPWFVDFFYRRLAPTANPMFPDYPFVSRCGDEMNYVKPADTPIVFTRMEQGRLFYGVSLSVPFNASSLVYSPDGVLYHAAPVGDRGRLVPALATELGCHIEHWGPMYALHDPSTGVATVIPPVTIPDGLRLLRPKEDNMCVGCGMANPWSLRLSFVFDEGDGVVRTWLAPNERMNGAMETVHGGFVSLLLDETMGKSLSVRGIKAPTAQLNVRFRAPMMMHVQHEIRSWIERIDGRKNFLKGVISRADDPDRVVAEADALFITVRPESIPPIV